jgi:putative aldouronate transport system substrate-binding protein
MNGVRQNGSFNEVHPIAIFEKIKANERNGAQVAKIEEETFIKFVTGEESIDNFDGYVEKWNQQGGQAILDEMSTIIKENN